MLRTTGLWGCGAGDGSTLDDGGRLLSHPYAPSLGSRYGAVSFAPTYQGVGGVFFAEFCTGCHGGASSAKGLDLELSVGHENVVGARSLQRSELFLIEAGNADRSYLIRKLEGGPRLVGRQMPRNRPARPGQEIALVREWVDSGAARN